MKTKKESYADIASVVDDKQVVVVTNGKSNVVRTSGGCFSNVEVFLRTHAPHELLVEKQLEWRVGYFASTPVSDGGVGTKRARAEEGASITTLLQPSYRELAAKVVALGGLPLNFFESPGGRLLLRALGGKDATKGLSRANVTRAVRTLHERMQGAAAEKVKSHLQSGAKVCMQADAWTSVGRSGYLGIVLHWVTDSFQHQTVRAALRDPKGDLKAEHLRSITTAALAEYNVTPADLAACIYDNATNLQGMFPNSVRCLIHTAMLAVRDAVRGTPWLTDLFAASNNVSTTMLASTKRLEALEAYQKAKGKPILRPKSMSPTRWLTNYLQLERLLEIVDSLQDLSMAALGMTVDAYSDMQTNMALIKSDPATVSAAMKLLGDVHKMVLVLSTRTAPTGHLVLQFIEKFTTQSSELAENHTTTVGGREFGAQFNEAWTARFGDTWTSNLIWRAARLLHPNTVFSTKKGELDAVAALLKETHLVKDAAKLVPEVVDDGKSPGHGSAVPNMRSTRAGDDGNPFAAGGAPQSAWDTEINTYKSRLASSDRARTQDLTVAAFWAPLKHVVPNLAAVARSVLAVPASTIDVESLFSTAGNIITPHRSRLAPRLAEKLILLNCWLRNDEWVRTHVPELNEAHAEALDWVEGMVEEEADHSGAAETPAAGGAGGAAPVLGVGVW